MSEHERQEFLAGLHVGVISIERADGPPLTVPIWYGYEPGGLVWIITGAESLKGRLLNAARRFSSARRRGATLLQVRQRRGTDRRRGTGRARSRPTPAGAPLLRPGAGRRLRGRHQRGRQPQVLNAPDSLVDRRLHEELNAREDRARPRRLVAGRRHSPRSRRHDGLSPTAGFGVTPQRSKRCLSRTSREFQPARRCLTWQRSCWSALAADAVAVAVEAVRVGREDDEAAGRDVAAVEVRRRRRDACRRVRRVAVPGRRRRGSPAVPAAARSAAARWAAEHRVGRRATGR